MTNLIAEDLLLLLLDDDDGKPVVDSIKFSHALAGALVLELGLAGSLQPEDPTKGGKSKVLAVGAPPSDALLGQVWQYCQDKPRRPAAVIQKFDSKVKDELLQRIVDKGYVQQEKRKILGLFPTTEYPEADPRREAEVRAALESVLIDSAEPDAALGSLVALLHAIDAVGKVFPHADKKAIKARAQQVADGNWAGDAVRQAVTEIQTAVMTAVMVPVITTSATT